MCVVAHVKADSADAVDLEFVRRAFLARQRFWPDGEAVHPVNLPASSTLRAEFSRLVLGESVKDLVPYWNERYFHGTRPPPTVASEAAVLLFVQRTRGGVGYVGEPLVQDLPDDVRTLMCVGGPGSEGARGTQDTGSTSDPVSMEEIPEAVNTG